MTCSLLSKKQKIDIPLLFHWRSAHSALEEKKKKPTLDIFLNYIQKRQSLACPDSWSCGHRGHHPWACSVAGVPGDGEAPVPLGSALCWLSTGVGLEWSHIFRQPAMAIDSCLAGRSAVRFTVAAAGRAAPAPVQGAGAQGLAGKILSCGTDSPEKGEGPRGQVHTGSNMCS